MSNPRLKETTPMEETESDITISMPIDTKEIFRRLAAKDELNAAVSHFKSSYKKKWIKTYFPVIGTEVGLLISLAGCAYLFYLSLLAMDDYYENTNDFSSLIIGVICNIISAIGGGASLATGLIFFVLFMIEREDLTSDMESLSVDDNNILTNLKTAYQLSHQIKISKTIDELDKCVAELKEDRKLISDMRFNYLMSLSRIQIQLPIELNDKILRMAELFVAPSAKKNVTDEVEDKVIPITLQI